MLRRLLEGVGEPEEDRFAPRPSEEGETDGEAVDEAGRNRDGRIPRHGGGGRAFAEPAVAVEEIGHAGRSDRGRDEGVESVSTHDRIDPVRTRDPAAGGQGLEVFRRGERPLRLGLEEGLLSEPGHLLLPVGLVERDDVRERPDGGRGAEPGEVRREPGLQLVEEDRRLRLRDRREAGKRGRIDQLGPLRSKGGERPRHQGLDAVVESEEVPRDADPRPPETLRVEREGVVGGAPAVGFLRGGVPGVGAGEDAEEERGVAHRPGHRSGGVLRRGDRDDPRPGEKADRRLDPDDSASRRGADDGAVGLRSDGGRAEARRHGGSRAGARSARIPVEGVRVLRQPAARAPAARRGARADVGPLGEVRLPEEDGARLAKPPDEERVGRGTGSDERERPCRRRHPVGRVDVVLHEDRNPVERPARPLFRPLAVEGVGRRERVGVGLDHGPERGPFRSIAWILARYASASERAVYLPLFIPSARSPIVASESSNGTSPAGGASSSTGQAEETRPAESAPATSCRRLKGLGDSESPESKATERSSSLLSGR